MQNADEAPPPVPFPADDMRRPVGVSILSVLTAIMGLVLLVAFAVLLRNWQENNEFAISQRLAPSVFWLFSGLSVVLAFVAAIGMWRGRKWGWWITCCGLVLFIIQNFASAAMANFFGGAPSFETVASVDSLKFVVRGFVFVAVLVYWLRVRVRKYFHVEQTGGIKAIALAGVCGIGITTIITVVLQAIFLYRSR